MRRAKTVELIARWSLRHPARVVQHRSLLLRDLYSRRGAAEIERGPQAWRRLEGVEQRVSFYPEQRGVHLCCDRGVPRGVVEQAALAEAVARTQMHNGSAVPVDDDAAL